VDPKSGIWCILISNMSFENFPTGDAGEQGEQIPFEAEGQEEKISFAKEVKLEDKDSNGDFEFLEKEVFTNLGITAEDEKKYLDGVEHQDNKELMDKVDKVSFPNIRDSVKMFFDYYCEKGIYNHEKMRRERKEAEEKAWADFWQAEGGRTNEEGVKIDSRNRPLTHWENGRMIEDRVNAAHPLDYEGNKIIFDRKDVIQKLEEELAKVRENSTLTYNVHYDAVEKIFEAGKILPMTEQPEDVRLGMKKTGPKVLDMFGSADDDYDDRRRMSEEVMGIHAQKNSKPVYAALAGGSDKSLERGAAPQYGEVVLVFSEDKLRDRVIFVEGDSMNPMGMIDAIRPKEKSSVRNGLEHRMLNRAHAEVAKAIYNLSRQFEDPYYGKEDDLIGHKAVQYIEAPILGGVDMSYIKEIVVDFPEIEFGMEGFKKDYPQYAHLIRFSKSESED